MLCNGFSFAYPPMIINMIQCISQTIAKTCYKLQINRLVFLIFTKRHNGSSFFQIDDQLQYEFDEA